VHALLAVKKHRARCLKILTNARLQIESETNCLISSIFDFVEARPKSVGSDGSAHAKSTSGTPETIGLYSCSEFLIDLPRCKLVFYIFLLFYFIPSVQLPASVDTFPKSHYETPDIQYGGCGSAERRRIGHSPRLSSSSFVRAKRALESIDLNQQAPDADLVLSPRPKRRIRVKFADTPWALGLRNFKADIVAATEFYEWVTVVGARDDW
jgi:hypothetical protein